MAQLKCDCNAEFTVSEDQLADGAIKCPSCGRLARIAPVPENGQLDVSEVEETEDGFTFTIRCPTCGRTNELIARGGRATGVCHFCQAEYDFQVET